jgi:hypothetical protein
LLSEAHDLGAGVPLLQMDVVVVLLQQVLLAPFERLGSLCSVYLVLGMTALDDLAVVVVDVRLACGEAQFMGLVLAGAFRLGLVEGVFVEFDLVVLNADHVLHALELAQVSQVVRGASARQHERGWVLGEHAHVPVDTPLLLLLRNWFSLNQQVLHCKVQMVTNLSSKPIVSSFFDSSNSSLVVC